MYEVGFRDANDGREGGRVRRCRGGYSGEWGLSSQPCRRMGTELLGFLTSRLALRIPTLNFFILYLIFETPQTNT